MKPTAWLDPTNNTTQCLNVGITTDKSEKGVAANFEAIRGDLTGISSDFIATAKIQTKLYSYGIHIRTSFRAPDNVPHNVELTINNIQTQ